MAYNRTRDTDGRTEKAITSMRHEFGGHPYDRDESITRQRRKGKVAPFFTFPDE